jgi:hypothetical protein
MGKSSWDRAVRARARTSLLSCQSSKTKIMKKSVGCFLTKKDKSVEYGYEKYCAHN